MAAPFAQEGAGDSRLGGEDGDRDGALTGGQVLRALRDDVITVEALVLDALVAQELRQALGRRDGAALPPCMVTVRYVCSPKIVCLWMCFLPQSACSSGLGAMC